MPGQWLRLWLLLARDALVISGVAYFWLHQDDRWPAATLAAVLVAFCGYLLHEWGHLLGAMLARGSFELPMPFESPFLFRFDRNGNSRAQFFSMALGGFASSLLTVLALVALLPWPLLATKIALTLTGLGVLATLVIEVPEFLRVWRGAPIPDGAAFVSEQRPRRH